ncbi:MAG: hypothetical protein H5T94_04815 [Pseudothermotoga sp.]|nr:hypothetical protein [Pseudothermotoga sp.]
MKKVLLVLAVAVLLWACTLDQTGHFVAARVEISDFYYEFPTSDYLKVVYEITNIGNLPIDYYEVYFEVCLIDGSKTTDFDNGVNLLVGNKRKDTTYIYTQGKAIKSVNPVKVRAVNIEYGIDVICTPQLTER